MDRGIPILLYHQVVDEDFDLTNVPVGVRPYYLRKNSFIQQMGYLFGHGFKTLTLRDFVSSIKNGLPIVEKAVVLTFDDGDISNYTLAYPILREFGFKATFFLIVRGIDNSQGLKWGQITEMVGNGMEIGSHTMTHPFPSDLKEDGIFWELKRSKEVLEDHLKEEIDFLSIPRGIANPNWLTIAHSCGYKAVCTSKVGLNNHKADPFALRRIGIRDGFDLKAFSLIVNRDLGFLFSLTASDYIKQMLKNGLGQKRWFRLRERLLKTRYAGY